ncbi:urea transporter [Kitasatospora phosalacinea]|uniref:urea transporter n=1 Tax=Kitasatospora phosalacinea TaxID=2065 RepID=UPI002553BC6F|nr:urea transporter [Kitasatospora phosalacinea]
MHREPLAYFAAALRGVAQVGLQPGLPTGALVLAALWAAGWEVGLPATLGTLVSTAAAYAFGVDRGSVALGLQGYSGCLTGIALVGSLGNRPATYLLAAVGCVLCTVLTAALTALLAPCGLTALTAPFCLVTGVLLAAVPAPAPAPGRMPSGAATGLTAADLWHAFFANVAQVFLVDSWYVGLIVLVGLACADARVVLAAALGSAVGTATAWALGAPAGQVAAGLHGYDAVLVGIALGAVLLPATPWNAGYALFGAAVSTVLAAALTALLAPLGGRPLTWPFVLTTWALLAAVPRLPRLRAAPG